MVRAALVVLAGLLVASCATQSGMRKALFKRASFDLSCDEAKLQAVELGSVVGGSERVYGVSGCEKRATYVVSGDGVNGYTVLLNSDVTAPK